MSRWPSGKATVCKTVYTSSNLVRDFGGIVSRPEMALDTAPVWKVGRVDECTGLENQRS